MPDLKTQLRTLRRPRLLTIAARQSSMEYERSTHLRRLLKLDRTPTIAEALTRLLEIEDEMNHARERNAGEYSFARHVEVLSAMMVEIKLWNQL